MENTQENSDPPVTEILPRAEANSSGRSQTATGNRNYKEETRHYRNNQKNYYNYNTSTYKDSNYAAQPYKDYGNYSNYNNYNSYNYNINFYYAKEHTKDYANNEKENNLNTNRKENYENVRHNSVS